ncbi:hypothetical protein M6I34_06180 [Burkholderiaceae bacterium FT117]|uniref:hypothetical protein n=1 Tax=Zeimonas sediminis TaxID=2944268 RepID=UPI002342CE0E|nr:hypothetical protein [Zeimonas sediminis]MCM5570089.1 hypothetical protein [Zeimonas sediminis]
MKLPKAVNAASLACCMLAAALGAHAQEILGDLSAPLAGRVFGNAVHVADPDELRFVIVRELTDRYAAERGIRVTQTERDAYVAHVESFFRQERARRTEQRDVLKRRLEAGAASTEERTALASELDSAERALAALAEPTGSPQETRAARNLVADAFIRQWKINSALHRQYGGRVGYQQGGPEPLDAYRRFLEEREARGDFAIYDERMRTAFWRYYLTDSIHDFYAPGSREESRAFAAPPWRRD